MFLKYEKKKIRTLFLKLVLHKNFHFSLSFVIFVLFILRIFLFNFLIVVTRSNSILKTFSKVEICSIFT